LAPDFRLPVRLWRQPQLIALAAIASQNILYRILAMPFIVYAALVLATSCIGVPSSDTDARRLSWLLGKGTKSSLLCRLAFKLWKARLLKTYPEGMKTVAQMYYQGGHPFGRHMVKY
jgi:hypothetical protein